MVQSLGTNITVFLVFLHVLSFYAGANGYIYQAQGQNPHQAFLNNVTGSDIKGSLSQTNSSTLSSTEDFAFKSTDFKNVVTDILLSPYNAISNTGWPTMLTLLMKILLGVLEVYAIGSFIRGVNL